MRPFNPTEPDDPAPTPGEWKARWKRLSAAARLCLVSDVKLGSSRDMMRPPFIPVNEVPTDVAEELTNAGLVERRPGPTPRAGERLVVPRAAHDFVGLVQDLYHFHLLDTTRPSRLGDYVTSYFGGLGFTRAVGHVLRLMGVDDEMLHVSRHALLERFVPNREWPRWAGRSLQDPVADAVVEAVEAAGGVVTLDELPGRIPDHDPKAVIRVAGLLVQHLALFDDLRPGSLDFVLGFLPAVREGLVRAGQERPPLRARSAPHDLLPEDGFEVNDLRGFLLELSSPARLRQDGSLFQKEQGRFAAALEPLPAWAEERFRPSSESRLRAAATWCRSLELGRSVRRGDETWLELTGQGQEWLSSAPPKQYRRLFDFLLSGQSPAGHYAWSAADTLFLGSWARAYSRSGPRRAWEDVSAAERERLRQSFYSTFADLSPGSFVSLDAFLGRATFGSHNPLNLGTEAARVTVLTNEGVIPPLEDLREQAGRRCLEALIAKRLLPLGCLQAGVDEEGEVCVARHARLDAYFGQRVPDDALAGGVGEARVVVQPDFSVVVIGPGAAPLADLAPFCERTGGRGGSGAVQLRITKAAVVNAVAGGLGGQEIVDRLQRHASVPVPANVLREVSEWSAWVRAVEAADLLVLRCPDRGTADRVASALGRAAERLGDTLLGLHPNSLGRAETTRLRDHGILVRRSGASHQPASGKKRRHS